MQVTFPFLKLSRYSPSISEILKLFVLIRIDNNHEKLTLNGEEKLSREEVNKTRKMIFQVTKNCNEVKQ